MNCASPLNLVIGIPQWVDPEHPWSTVECLEANVLRFPADPVAWSRLMDWLEDDGLEPAQARARLAHLRAATANAAGITRVVRWFARDRLHTAVLLQRIADVVRWFGGPATLVVTDGCLPPRLVTVPGAAPGEPPAGVIWVGWEWVNRQIPDTAA